MTKRWVLFSSLLGLTISCASSRPPSMPSTSTEAVYAALARRLLTWAGTNQGVFEARPAFAQLDSLTLANHLASVVRAVPDLDPAAVSALRTALRDTSCLPLPSDWRPHRLRLETMCGPSSVKYPVADRIRRSRLSALGSSAIAFSSDTSRALVVGVVVCGGLCAHAGYYVFDRTETGWDLARVVVVAES